MPYYNQYPQPGQPQYYQPSAQQMLTMPMYQPATSEGIIWVQGEVGARAYPVPPGKMMILMDSEDSVFYIKAVDQYGMPQPLRKFHFTEVHTEQKNLSETSQQMSPDKYITKEEFEQRLKERLDELIK